MGFSLFEEFFSGFQFKGLILFLFVFFFFYCFCSFVADDGEAQMCDNRVFVSTDVRWFELIFMWVPWCKVSLLY